MNTAEQVIVKDTRKTWLVSYNFPLGSTKVAHHTVKAHTKQEALRAACVNNPTLKVVLVSKEPERRGCRKHTLRQFLFLDGQLITSCPNCDAGTFVRQSVLGRTIVENEKFCENKKIAPATRAELLAVNGR